MTSDTRTKAEQRLAKAISHPLRFQILIKLNEAPNSPSKLADALGERAPNVAYHVKFLEKLGAIELVDTRQRRGMVEHIYRATARPFFDDAHWAKLPVSVRRQFQDQTLQGVWDHLVEAFDEGGLDHPETHITWTSLDLDPEGFRAMVDLVNETLERALSIQAESAGRIAKSGDGEDDVERTELTLLHFHRPRPIEKSASPDSGRRKRAKPKKSKTSNR